MRQGPQSSQARSLVTGATGFVGCWLTQALVDRGDAVVGVNRRACWPAAWRHLAGRAELRVADLLDGEAVEAVCRDFRPTHVYHLAGFAAVGASFRDPEAAWAGNLTATRRLCEAVARWGGRPRVLFVGSGMVYGPPADPGAAAFTEDSPLRPDTPYAASKAAADLACFQYGCSSGVEVIRARPFNHIGPHQSAEFAVPNFARQLVAVERGQQPPVLETGDLTTRRDFSDVRDVVAAYLLLMEKGRAGEAYNIGVGRSWSMREIVDRMLALTGLRVELKTRADLLRPSEPADVRVDASKLRRETGWSPHYSLDQTLTDTLTACRLVAG
jgi:GDP-4-dehydro-6-deoxy-D-mannose reductase